MPRTGDGLLSSSFSSKTASRTYFKLTKLSDDFFYPVIYSLFTANQEAGAKEFPKASTINMPRTILKEEAGR